MSPIIHKPPYTIFIKRRAKKDTLCAICGGKISASTNYIFKEIKKTDGASKTKNICPECWKVLKISIVKNKND